MLMPVATLHCTACVVRTRALQPYMYLTVSHSWLVHYTRKILVECLALWGECEQTPPVNVVAVYSTCDKITVVVLKHVLFQ